MDDLDRLYQRLLDAVREGAPHLRERRFRLGDIPQHLLPYRLHRRELGFESVQQYERALARLAAGERGYLSADAAVHDAFRRAADGGAAGAAGAAPVDQLLRQYGDAAVALAPDSRHRADTPAAGGPATGAPAVTAMDGEADGAIDQHTAEMAVPEMAVPRPAAPERMPGDVAAREAPTSEMAVPETAVRGKLMPETATPNAVPARPGGPGAAVPGGLAGDAAGGGPPVIPIVRVDGAEGAPPPARPNATPAAPPRNAAMPFPVRPPTPVVGGNCRNCGRPLPADRGVTFCPYCGENLTIRRCPACSTELEAGWRFCITCGREVDAPVAADGA